MLDRASRGVLLRALPVAAVFVLTVVAFEAGVDVSDRPGMPTAPLVVQIYYAIGLFLLGGMDLGVPRGGPEWARALLWGAYFLGPAITTSAAVEGVVRLSNPRWLRRLRNRDHTVLVGTGRLGALYLEAIAQAEPHRRVAAVDRDPDSPGAQEIARRRNGAVFLRGDIRRASTRHLLALERAHAVVLCTDDDLVNLGAAWEIAQAHPALPIAAHVSDIALHRLATALGPRIRVFNSHEVAAAHLFEGHLASHFAATASRDVVVIAGFGRFGQTILQYVHAHSGPEVAGLVVVDRNAAERLRQFREQVGAAPQGEAIDGDVADPASWDRVVVEVARHDVIPVVVLATDDERVNLQAAIGLRKRLPDALIFVRVPSRSAFVAELASQHRFETLAVDRMLLAALCDHYQACTR